MEGAHAEYRRRLPETVTVHVTHDEHGFGARVKELPHCYTQADSYLELVQMLNDAIFTYLDIPSELIGKVGYYMPKEVVEEANRMAWQAAVAALAADAPSRWDQGGGS
jgi:predicted RNase H-like HicB family nuclease